MNPVGESSEIVWLPVRGFEGRYEVSSSGEVRTVARLTNAWADGTHQRKHASRVLKQFVPLRPGRVTYARVNLNRGGRRQHVPTAVHVIVLEAFVGPRPEGMEGRHLDGDSLNNRLTNLAWGSPAMNSGDRDLHGTTARGESHGKARLTESDVIYIRSCGEPGAVLARRFGVHKQTIYGVLSGKNWRHVKVSVPDQGASL